MKGDTRLQWIPVAQFMLPLCLHAIRDMTNFHPELMFNTDCTSRYLTPPKPGDQRSGKKNKKNQLFAWQKDPGQSLGQRG